MGGGGGWLDYLIKLKSIWAEYLPFFRPNSAENFAVTKFIADEKFQI